MGNKIKKYFMMLSLAILVVATVGGKAAKVEAKVKDGTYCFSSFMATKFQVKNSKLILKVSKSDSEGITKKNDKKYKKYEFSAKVSKSCKYRWEYFERGTGKSDGGSTTYNDVKKSIKEDRASYIKNGYCSNVGLSRIVVKNNKVVKIVYFFA